MLEIGNFVWRDTNGDGLQQAGEPPLTNVVMELRDAATDALIATTSTDSSGRYLFDAVHSSLQPDTAYIVSIPRAQLPASLTPTWSRANADPTLDSNGRLDGANNRVSTRVRPSLALLPLLLLSPLLV